MAWEAIFTTAKAIVTELNEKNNFSFVVLDADGKVLGSDFVGSDQMKGGAIAKGNVVIQDKSDAKLWNPATKFGGCGICYVMCGCCCCDFNMLMGALCCTKKLHLLGALPVKLEDGSIGALCVAGSNDCEVDKEIARRALDGNGYVLREGCWVSASAPETMDREVV